MTIALNDQQAAGMEKVKAWYENARPRWDPFHDIGGGPGTAIAEVFTWFGYAGTGKTFTAARIPEALGLKNVVFGTYTGKAASVLRKSLNRYGVSYNVSTIHSAIYFPTTSKEAREALNNARDHLSSLMEHKDNMDPLTEQDRLGYVIEQGWANLLEFAGELSEVSESIPALEAAARKLRFEFNPESDWSTADLIILDEVSMVNAKLAADIESYGVPILVLGDPAQLPPVEGGGYYTDREADVLLTRIERQAIEGSPIIELATRVRESQGRGLGLAPSDMRPRSLAEALEADMVLTWTNKRRWAMINAMRKRLGRRPGVPVKGDTIMNLVNNKDMAVFNGQTFTVIESKPFRAGTEILGWDMLVIDEEGQEREIGCWADGFIGQDEQVRAKNTGLGMRGDRILATFAQAITVHKAQGSEAERVYVVNEIDQMISMTSRREPMSAALEQGRRWLYTAVTRARSQVTITRPN